MADEETYLHLLDTILQHHIDLVGEKVALTAARKAPLEIDTEGTVTGFYGDGREALDILTDLFIEMAGQEVTLSRIRSIVEDELDEQDYDTVPERIRPHDDSEKQQNGVIERVRGLVSF
jgi:hypothetical protein